MVPVNIGVGRSLPAERKVRMNQLGFQPMAVSPFIVLSLNTQASLASSQSVELMWDVSCVHYLSFYVCVPTNISMYFFLTV